MSNSSETWQWIDEDPIEKLLRPAPGSEPVTKPAAGWSFEKFIASGRAQFERKLFEEAAESFHAAFEAEPSDSGSGRSPSRLCSSACATSERHCLPRRMVTTTRRSSSALRTTLCGSPVRQLVSGTSSKSERDSRASG